MLFSHLQKKQKGAQKASAAISHNQIERHENLRVQHVHCMSILLLSPPPPFFFFLYMTSFLKVPFMQ